MPITDDGDQQAIDEDLDSAPTGGGKNPHVVALGILRRARASKRERRNCHTASG
jgi:hypothetical protein